MIGIDFAFTHYSPHSVAVMASGQRQRKAILIRGLAVETHKVRKTCCQFIVPFYP
jgi:cytidine deaminase